MVCISFPFQLGFETKELHSKLNRKTGDSFDLMLLPLKTYDLAEIDYQRMISKQLKSFLDYLIGVDSDPVKLSV